MFTSVKSPLLPFLSGTLLYSASILAQVTPVPNQDYTVIDRGQDFAVYRRTPMLTNDTGLVGAQTNEFTVLDHGMNYLQNGEWHESQDLVESFADGAIARYGAYQTIFSPDLNSEAVFDISTPDSQRIRGGVRAIQLTDVATGKSVGSPPSRSPHQVRSSRPTTSSTVRPSMVSRPMCSTYGNIMHFPKTLS